MKTLRELTTELRTLCNEGYSDVPVLTSVLEAIYKVGDVHKMTVGNDEQNSKTYFVFDTEVLNDY